MLAGGSAGSLCWHLGGTTDSFGDGLDAFTGTLGWLPFSNGVHDDLEDQPRRERYRDAVTTGELPPGHATEDGVGLHRRHRAGRGRHGRPRCACVAGRPPRRGAARCPPARRLRDDIEFLLVAELVFFSGTMDCGKSTLALQMDHNHGARGRAGLIFTKMDRAGESVLSSRLGLSTSAVEVTDDLDFWDEIVGIASSGQRVDYLICDEAQFYTRGAGRAAGPPRRRDVRRRLRVRHHRRLPHLPVPRLPADDRAGRPGPGAAGRGAVLVRLAGHPQRPGRRRRHGRRGRAGRGR